MLTKQYSSTDIVRYLGQWLILFFVLLSGRELMAQKSSAQKISTQKVSAQKVPPQKVSDQSASQLLRDGSRFQAADDTTDRAPNIYRALIIKYPKSAEAESAQYFLGTYYNRKFFILEQRSNVQDWGSLNKAEEELYGYIGKYPGGFYVADAYNVLAIIALRRGWRDTAAKLWDTMSHVADKDRRVYIFRVTWSPSNDDVIKAYCDTRSLASASLSLLNQKSSFEQYQKSSFEQLVAALTTWARANCHDR